MKFYTNVILRGSNILFRGYDNGKRIQQKIKCKPYLFIESRNPDKASYSTIYGTKVDRMDFESVNDAKEFVESYTNVENFSIHGQSPHMFHYTWINDTFTGDVQYDPTKIRVAYIDIEVASDDGFPEPEKADKEITAISMRFRDETFVFGCGDYKSSSEHIKYVKCTDEASLISWFIKSFAAVSPDVISGWNVENFDIPYIINRSNRLLGEEETAKLSPWNIINTRRVSRGKVNGESEVYEILGVSTLDYLPLYRKFTYTNQESYKLDHIALLELGEKKLDYSQYGNLNELYKQDYQLFIDYNVKDVDLVIRLEDKLKLIELVYAMAYSAKTNYTDTFGVVRLWDIIVHNFLINRNIVITPKDNIPEIPYKMAASSEDPITGEVTDYGSFTGAYVKAPQVGLHNWVVSFDLNSLYPHLIMQYNISPETYYSQCKGNIDVDSFLNGEANNWDTDLIKTANRCIFVRDKQGFLPELMQQYYDMRTVYKKKMIEAQKQYQKEKSYELEKEISKYNNLQLAFKIMLNSAYGALGNQYFRYYQLALAECITLSGQVTIRWIEDKMNQYLNSLLKTQNQDYVLASDTDSIYLCLDKLVKHVFKDEDDKKKIVDFLDKVCNEKLEPYIDKCYQELATYTNAYSQKMKMKRESIADKGIWTAKKRYILNVYDSEGVRYAQPKLKIMGIEAVKSSTPMSCRESIKNALKIIMTKDNESLIEYIKQFKTEFLSMPFEDIAFPRGCNGLNKYRDRGGIYKKGTPIHAKGALIYNHFVEKHNLSKKYQTISNGDKIKYCYLRFPNRYNIEVISCPGTLPPEFDLSCLIDYDMQFQKAFLEPLNGILEKIDWVAEKKHIATIEDFFQ
jgi:DNA polymerase elongation subunit (family B)